MRQAILLVCTAISGLFLVGTILPGSPNRPVTVKGRLLEACSCMVPCPCNFGQQAAPYDFCDSAAVFQLESGQVDGVALKSLRFALAKRAGSKAILFLNSGLTKMQQKALRKITNWILSFEGAALASELVAPIAVQFESNQLQCSVGKAIKITALPLRGNDGKSPIMVSHPWIFGSFPIISSQKCVANELEVQTRSLSFTYSGTNANYASFEFSPHDVR